MKHILILLSCVIYLSCNINNNLDKTIRRNSKLEFTETKIGINTAGDFTIFSTFHDGTDEYFANLTRNKIYISNLSNNELIDSINIIFEKKQIEKFGSISSFCFNGKDSLFLLLSRAVLFIQNKKLAKTILINELDTFQFNKLRFANLEDAPIYYDENSNELIGQVYCSKCKQSDTSFYQSSVIGHLSIETGKLKLFNISFSEKYIKDYYGFANHVYIQSRDSFSIISFPCEEKVFLLNRITNTNTSFFVKSIYQTNNAIPLEKLFSENREEKMRHLTTVPFYTQILFDPYKQLYYRFFLKDSPLKNVTGKYNTFKDKGIVLMILNKDFEVLSEFELSSSLNEYFSFVTKDGLFIKDMSYNSNDSCYFKTLKLK